MIQCPGCGAAFWTKEGLGAHPCIGYYPNHSVVEIRNSSGASPDSDLDVQPFSEDITSLPNPTARPYPFPIGFSVFSRKEAAAIPFCYPSYGGRCMERTGLKSTTRVPLPVLSHLNNTGAGFAQPPRLSPALFSSHSSSELDMRQHDVDYKMCYLRPLHRASAPHYRLNR